MDTNHTRKRRPPAVSETDLAAVSANVRAAREAAGLSRYALSAAAGLSPAAVGLIESGHSTPALGTLLALARALSVPLTQIVQGLPAAQKIPRKIR